MSNLVKMNFAKKEDFLEAVGVDDKPLFLGTNQLMYEDGSLSVSLIVTYFDVVEGVPMLLKWEQHVGREKQLNEENVKYLSDEQIEQVNAAMEKLNQKLSKTFDSLRNELITDGFSVYDGYITEEGDNERV